MKKYFTLIFVLGNSLSAFSQNQSGSASQPVQLILSKVIDLKFAETSSSQGPVVNMNFQDLNAYSRGVISGMQELEVYSNDDFKISIQTDAPNFVYHGMENPSKLLPVNNTLFISVADHTTGGLVNAAFDKNYQTLSQSSQDLILNGTRGAGKKLVVSYKAKPELGYPAGVYSVGVIYTATQP